MIIDNKLTFSLFAFYLPIKGDLCGTTEMWITRNEIILLESPGLGSTYPCSISCLWIIHASHDDFKLYAEIIRIGVDPEASLLVGNGCNPQDKSSIFADLKIGLSPGTTYVSLNSTIWISFHTTPCVGNIQTGNGFFELKISDVNETGEEAKTRKIKEG